MIDENKKLSITLKDKINELEEVRITAQELEIALQNIRMYEPELQRLRDAL